MSAAAAGTGIRRRHHSIIGALRHCTAVCRRAINHIAIQSWTTKVNNLVLGRGALQPLVEI